MVLTEQVDEVVGGQVARLDVLTRESGFDEFLEVLGGWLFVQKRTVHRPPLSARPSGAAPVGPSGAQASDRQVCNSYSVRGRWETLANPGGMLPIIRSLLQFSTVLSPKGAIGRV